jgi:hypothetical protein
MSYLMTVGRPDASLALLLPSSSLWLGSETTDTTFVSTERLLSEHQIDFDVVDEDALARDLKALPGGFETRSGNRYRTVIVPAAQLISADVLERLKTFAKGGGKVVFLGGAPKWIAGASIRDGKQGATADFAWATVIDATLPPTPTPPAFPPAEPLQAQVVPSGVVEGLASAVVAPSVQSVIPDTALRVMKRKWRDADVYLLFNEGATAIDHPVTLSGEGRIAEAWDAQTGVVAPVVQKHSAGHATIQLHLRPYEATVIVLR